MDATLDAAFAQFNLDREAFAVRIRDEPDLPLLRLSYDRMLQLKGVRGVDDWRYFLGWVVGIIHYQVLEQQPRLDGAEPADYWKSLALTNWYLGWSKSRRRARIVREARVPAEPRPTASALIERDGIKCWRCGRKCDVEPGASYLYYDPESPGSNVRNPRYRTVGHVVRLVDGGKDSLDNARLECWECNTADGRVAWAEEMGRLMKKLADDK